MGYYDKHGNYLDLTAAGCPKCAGTVGFNLNTPPVGWRCPVCGGGVAPWLSRCPCVDEPTQAKSDPFKVDYPTPNGVTFHPIPTLPVCSRCGMVPCVCATGPL